MGNDGEVIFIVCPLYQHATAALSAPRRIDSKMKGSLSSSTILNEMTQDSVADSLDRCMLGDLCACLFAGPQEQILTVYFSKLKAMGRQQFLYFWTLDKLSPARCKHTWQGAIFLTYPPPMPENGGKKTLIASVIDLSFLLCGVCTQQRHFNYIGAFRLYLDLGSHRDRLPGVDQWCPAPNIPNIPISLDRFMLHLWAQQQCTLRQK